MQWRLTHFVAVVTMLFLLLPFVVVVGASLDTGSAYQVRFPPHGFSFERYFQISPGFLKAFVTSLVLGTIVSLLASGLGLMAAVGIVRGENWVSPEFLQSFFRLPIQIPLVVTGAAFLQVYYAISTLTGVSLIDSYVGLTLAHLFIALPYAVGSCLSTLARFDLSLEEAALGLGATNWNTFWQVTFPAVRPGVLVAAFYAFIVSFGDVPVAIFLASADRMTLPVKIFLDMQFDLQPGIFAVATVVAVISLGLTAVVQKILGFDMVSPSGGMGGKRG